MDPANQLLYWTAQSGEVFRSDYDGTDPVMLLSNDGHGASGLALDLAAGHMYLAIPNQYRIVRANLDGTALQTLLSTSERPFGMELFKGRMYWTDLDGGRLRSAKLDGSDATTILSGLMYPRQISILVTDQDSDVDGVLDDVDVCPDTPPGAVVNASGCAIEQLVICEGTWKNHGQYVSAVTRVAQDFASQGFLTDQQKAAVISSAAGSDCGKR